MTLIQLVLWIHVAAGFAAWALGIVAMRARKLRGTHTWVGYIAMVTAYLVNNWHIAKAIGIPLSQGWGWALPTLIGSPIIWWVNLRIQKRSAGS